MTPDTEGRREVLTVRGISLSSTEVEALLIPAPGEGDSADHWQKYADTRLARATARGQLRIYLKEATDAA